MIKFECSIANKKINEKRRIINNLKIKDLQKNKKNK